MDPLSKEEEIVEEAVLFFLLISDPDLSTFDQEEILSAIPPLMLAHHNSYLKAIPNLEEIHQALFSLLGDKAPGPNGFPTFFF